MEMEKNQNGNIEKNIDLKEDIIFNGGRIKL